MSIRANADKKFLLKYLLIAIACLAFALWSLYDGFVGYPSELPRARAYEALSDLDATKKTTRWQVIAKEKNWTQGKPDSSKEIEEKIIWQYFMAGISTLVGVPLLIWYFKTKGTWLELDGDRLRASWGPEFNLDSISELDKKKWEKKGIAKIKYQDGSEIKRFKIDDFMYSREQVDQILEQIESKLKPGVIVGEVSKTEPADGTPTTESTGDNLADDA